MTANIEHITSTSNATIKFLKGLDRKRNRNESGLFLVEGERLVRDGISHGWVPQILLIGKEVSEAPRLKPILEEAALAGAKLLTTTQRVLGAVAKKDNPQTLVAAFKQKVRNLASLETASPCRFIALYQVRDPGNLGTILRTADASNVQGVILIDQCCDPYSTECVRATMGSLFAVPFLKSSYEDFRSWNKKSKLRITASSVNATDCFDALKYGDKSVLLMGNEQSGIPAVIEAECDGLVRLPMSGAADSLNLAQATAIVSYQIWKEHRYVGSR